MKAEFGFGYDAGGLEKIGWQLDPTRHQRVLKIYEDLKSKESFFPSLQNVPIGYSLFRGGGSRGYVAEAKRKGIIIDTDFANCSEDSTYQLFQKDNAGVSMDTFIENVIAHEQGHILCDDIMDRGALVWKMTMKGWPISLPLPLDIALSEGFAFWFGDVMTGTKTPPEFLDAYSHADTKALNDTYQSLSEHSSQNGLLNTYKNAHRILARQIPYRFSYKNLSTSKIL